MDILLIEDCESDAALIKAQLEQPGDRFTCVRTLEDSAGLWHTHNLILIDLGLPDTETRYHAIEGIKEKTGGAIHSPVVVVITSADAEDLAYQVGLHGANGVIRKPLLQRADGRQIVDDVFNWSRGTQARRAAAKATLREKYKGNLWNVSPPRPQSILALSSSWLSGLFSFLRQ